MAVSETTTRVLVAAVGIPMAVVAIYAGGWVLAALLAAVSILAILEFFHLAAKKGAHPLTVAGALASVAFVVAAAYRPSGGPDQAAFGTLAVLVTLAMVTLAIWARGVEGQPLLSSGVTVAGVLYTGALLSFGLFLRHLPGVEDRTHGAALLLAPVALTWVSDTFAYFVGRAFGTRKLIPSVSPGKTVQGAVGAVLGTMAAGMGYSYLLSGFETYRFGLVEGALFGLLISVTAQIGDLAESLLKRDAAVKDSGRLLPGHGGALDRFDSLLFTLPVGYFFFRYLAGGPAF